MCGFVADVDDGIGRLSFHLARRGGRSSTRSMSSGLGESHVSWPGVGCVAAGAAFALAAREFERDAARLRDLPRYTDFAALDRDVRALEKAAAAKSRAAGNRTSTPSPSSPSDAPPPVSLVVALRGAAVPEPGAPLVPCRHARATAHRHIAADGSSGEPQAPRLSALYVESTVEQHLARQIQRNGEWLRETHVVARERRECPAWAVEDRDGARVNVHRAAHEGDHSDAAAANDWALTVAHDHFAPAEADAGRSSAGNVLAHLADASAGFRILGTRRRERVLPRGTELTVVGEVTRAPPGPPGTRRREPRKEGTKEKDAGADERDEGFGLEFDPSEGAGELRLRKARRGRRFGGVSGGRADVFVATQRSFDDHLAGLGFFGRACRTLSFACFVAGACVSVVRFVNAARTRRAARKFRERLAEAARARARGEAAAAARGGGIVGDAGADAAAVSGAADDDVLRSSVVVGEEGGSAAGLAPGETCVVCLFSRAEMCFRECGHLVCCDVCAARVDRCPLCRRKSGVMRVYRAGG